jgi:hypothetical protein
VREGYLNPSPKRLSENLRVCLSLILKRQVLLPARNLLNCMVKTTKDLSR